MIILSHSFTLKSDNNIFPFKESKFEPVFGKLSKNYGFPLALIFPSINVYSYEVKRNLEPPIVLLGIVNPIEWDSANDP